jgi:hypothetical protein
MADQNNSLSQKRKIGTEPSCQTLIVGSIGKNAMSHTDRVFALIAVAVGLVFTVGLWLLGLL